MAITSAPAEVEARELSQQMWELASPYLSEEDKNFISVYRDGDEWELLINFLAMFCADEGIQMPWSIRKFLDDTCWTHWEKIMELAIIGKPETITTMPDAEFQRLMATLPGDNQY